ncbi:MAG TPA: DoxX family protein [Xanthomonadales bacterium]|nr:DoxX family protein [Xanthomonadales bacterium]
MNLKNLMHTEAGWGMTILRIVTGVLFLGHGAPKFGFIGDGNLDGVAGMMGGLGLPAPMVAAFLLAFFETFGGAFLVIGLLTRFWSAGLAFAMFIAVTLVHLPNGMFAEGGYQWALLLMACSLALLFEGAGKASLDQKFGN